MLCPKTLRAANNAPSLDRVFSAGRHGGQDVTVAMRTLRNAPDVDSLQGDYKLAVGRAPGRTVDRDGTEIGEQSAHKGVGGQKRRHGVTALRALRLTCDAFLNNRTFTARYNSRQDLR